MRIVRTPTHWDSVADYVPRESSRILARIRRARPNLVPITWVWEWHEPRCLVSLSDPAHERADRRVRQILQHGRVYLVAIADDGREERLEVPDVPDEVVDHIEQEEEERGADVDTPIFDTLAEEDAWWAHSLSHDAVARAEWPIHSPDED